MIKQLVKVSLLLTVLSTSAFAAKYYSPQTPVHVRGYTRSDGTVVQPYYRARPGQRQDNELGLQSSDNQNQGLYNNNFNNQNQSRDNGFDPSY